jgi:GntR family transcriptional regulator, carbon starvation induced regulator
LEPIDSSEETQAQIAADRIIADIRSGSLAPGFKLRIAELRSRYGIGASPLREALSLVTSSGDATTESHRGYRVAEVSSRDLLDITRAREVIELGMLRESMQAHTDEWAIGIVTATERLRRLTARASPGQRESFEAIKLAHKELHIALVAGSGCIRLARTQALLFDQAVRYRDIMIDRVPSAQTFFDTHEELVNTVLNGDIEKACESLRQHLQRTFVEVYGDKTADPGALQVPGRAMLDTARGLAVSG